MRHGSACALSRSKQQKLFYWVYICMTVKPCMFTLFLPFFRFLRRRKRSSKATPTSLFSSWRWRVELAQRYRFYLKFHSCKTLNIAYNRVLERTTVWQASAIKYDHVLHYSIKNLWCECWLCIVFSLTVPV